MKKKRFAGGGEAESDGIPRNAMGFPDYYMGPDGKRVPGEVHREMLRRKADEKLMQDADEASKFSNKAKAYTADALTGVGRLLHGSLVEPTQEVSRLKERERRGAEARQRLEADERTPNKMAKGGSVKASSASRRSDGIAQRGKTKGRMI